MKFKRVIKVELTADEKGNIMRLLEADKDCFIDICGQIEDCENYMGCYASNCPFQCPIARDNIIEIITKGEYEIE